MVAEILKQRPKKMQAWQLEKITSLDAFSLLFNCLLFLNLVNFTYLWSCSFKTCSMIWAAFSWFMNSLNWSASANFRIILKTGTQWFPRSNPGVKSWTLMYPHGWMNVPIKFWKPWNPTSSLNRINWSWYIAFISGISLVSIGLYNKGVLGSKGSLKNGSSSNCLLEGRELGEYLSSFTMNLMAGCTKSRLQGSSMYWRVRCGSSIRNLFILNLFENKLFWDLLLFFVDGVLFDGVLIEGVGLDLIFDERLLFDGMSKPFSGTTKPKSWIEYLNWKCHQE